MQGWGRVTMPLFRGRRGVRVEDRRLRRAPWDPSHHRGRLASMSSDARSAQPRASGVGCSLLHLSRPGSGRGWLAGTGSRGAGEPETPCPRLVLDRCAPHAGPRLGAPRAPGHAARAWGAGPSSARDAAEPSCAASGPSGQASGHRGPALRSPGTGSARSRTWGEARAEEAEPRAWAHPLARGRGGGGAS